MKVFTIDKNLNGKEVIVEHNVHRIQGIPGERCFECFPKTADKPYFLNDSKETIFLTAGEAMAAIVYGEKAG